MRFYNTLTRRKDEFVPIEKNKVKMYSCGPTVYNYFHIGNARPFIIFDTLRNYLEYRGYEVTFVQNFTDVDDKIINRANEEGISPLEVADKYIKEYFVDADGLGIRRASVHPRVTECIEDIIEFIEELIQKGHAYEIDGDVYYDTKSFDGYGKLSRQNMEELNAGARIDVDDRKKSPSDFALWKKKKEGEIGWISPWGEGRPGWHIECSVMSRKYLGDTIDIHSGGQDLIFPHHENEIAQSEGRSGKEFAHYWLHNGYININNQKMSKSLNNFFTVREISEVIDLEIVRFFLLSAQYRNPVNFSQDLLDAAKSGMERLYNTKHKVEFLLEQAQGMIKEDEKEFVSKLPSYRELFIEAMDDDLNTADGISAIFELSKFINTTVSEKSSKEYLQECMNIFCELTNVLNIIQKKKSDGFDEDKINELIEQRSLAKKEKNFAEADRIRGQLHDMGVEVLDTRQGTTWKKID
ncbi:cysteine--tRNA ligase [Filifactor alocis ATCC 35896]|uniref:Cysteine--tRNA ligase n=1 Tax=Filifactor alocis (strain ATCC 35896 / CCUG 47790 / D40 B5) TaxID=546269 RepID=D6GRR5_FILAD|nr:cysteine--tRNA ligase [Filifactor alocis]EFE28356.1 cysteine--tRNA ligase [Filifactor alocis ATCC 35896]